MEFNFITIFLLGLCVLLMFATFYTLKQYKMKKNEGLSLEENIRNYTETLDKYEKKKELYQSEILQCKEKINDLEVKAKHLDKDYKDTLIVKKREIEEKQYELHELILLEKRSEELKKSVQELENKVLQCNEKLEEQKNEKYNYKNEIINIKKDIQLYSSTHDLIAVGFFEEPLYLYETSERFKEEIVLIRRKQKDLINLGNAITIPDNVPFTDSVVEGKKAVSGQSKIMLKAFNIETDMIIGTVKPSNFALSLEKIEKLANEIEKSALSLSCGFTEEYVKLKYDECTLQYQFKLKQVEEKEEQKSIKEQMREEQKAIKEYEIAIAKAEKEEKMYSLALDKARKELEIADNETKEELLAKISFLEVSLKEAQNQEERAKSMAEQTRRGHVYIISNIGSFGENIYKIGMTRRLEPLDRVKELGDASVPFVFDVHAMVYSDDAPRLERELHKQFSTKRLNAINYRKEFFNVSLLEIKEAVNNIIDIDVDFKMTALAEDYYESQKLKKGSGLNFYSTSIVV